MTKIGWWYVLGKRSIKICISLIFLIFSNIAELFKHPVIHILLLLLLFSYSRNLSSVFLCTNANDLNERVKQTFGKLWIKCIREIIMHKSSLDI